MAKRAAQGSGSIRQRPDGKWEGRYDAGRNTNGKRIQRSVYGKSQKEVLKKLDEVRGDLESGCYITPSDMTVSQWCDIWLNTYTGDIKYLTRRNYVHNIETHIKPHLGSKLIQKLDAHTVQGFYNELAKSGRKLQKGQIKEVPAGLSAKTIKNIHALLRRVLAQAVVNRIAKYNPADGCKPGSVIRKEMMVLQGEQIPAFMQACEDHKHGTLFLIMLFCGLRRGEALGIEWDNIDFNKQSMLISKQLQRIDGELQLVPTKSNKWRSITPPPTVFELLRQHRSMQAQSQLLAGQLWTNSGLVFTNDLGAGLDADAVYTSFKKMLNENNLPPIRIHDLRHSAATLMIMNGDDYKTISSALGHASVSFTLDVYGHVTPKMKSESANRMENFIQSLKSS